jgi:hypothetical protein
MQEERVKIRLPNAREKLQTLFPEDNRGDIRIEFGPKSFKLQKAFLRLESAYFKKAFNANQQVLTIQQKFNVPASSLSPRTSPTSSSVSTASPSNSPAPKFSTTSPSSSS